MYVNLGLNSYTPVANVDLFLKTVWVDIAREEDISQIEHKGGERADVRVCKISVLTHYKELLPCNIWMMRNINSDPQRYRIKY